MLCVVLKSLQAKQGSQLNPHLQITPTILLKLRKVWDSHPSDKDCIMLWAASWICLFGFMRAGEFTVPSDPANDASTHLSDKDMLVDSKSNPGMVKLHRKASKTDPFRQGVDILIGKTADHLCPVAVLLSYIAVRGYGEGPLFFFSNKRFLTCDRFVAKVREAMSLAGLNYDEYSGSLQDWGCDDSCPEWNQWLYNQNARVVGKICIWIVYKDSQGPPC